MLEWFYSDQFWLPEGYTSKDWEDNPNIRKSDDIYFYPAIIAIALYFIRNHLLIPYVFTPIAIRFKVRSKPYVHPVPNARLDELYSISRARPPRAKLVACAKEIDWQERKVERWLRQKALSQQMTTMEKFHDMAWHFTYYTFFFIFGLIVIRTKPWYKDSSTALDNFPMQELDTDVWWYYMIGTGFYFLQSLIFLQQDRKGDFYIMLTHHLVTINIMVFNWQMNSIRLCCVSLFYHEIVDIVLSSGKLCFYTGKAKLASQSAVPFFIVWFSTRLFCYPVYVLSHVLARGGYFNISEHPAVGVQKIASLLLFILHLLWTKSMIPVIHHKLFSKELIVDTRSSGEEEMSDEEKSEGQNETLKSGNKDSAARNRIKEATTIQPSAAPSQNGSPKISVRGF